jgi:uncharacterized protein GlcG (DUF336 family)
MALFLAEANKILQAAISKAEEMNIRLSVAVCDAGGHLMAFNRMEGANTVTSIVAPGKAAAAAAFGRASGTIQADSPVIQAVLAAAGGHMLPAQGGVPIFKDGQLLGSVGASGGTGQQDEECARAGLAAI